MSESFDRAANDCVIAVGERLQGTFPCDLAAGRLQIGDVVDSAGFGWEVRHIDRRGAEIDLGFRLPCMPDTLASATWSVDRRVTVLHSTSVDAMVAAARKRGFDDGSTAAYDRAEARMTVAAPDEDDLWFNNHDPSCEVCNGTAFVRIFGERARCPAANVA